MSSGNQHATLDGLIRLQRIDFEVLRIQRRLEEGPKLVERRGEKYRLGEARIAEVQEKIKHAKARVAESELELKSKEDAIKKSASQQLESRSNQEYKALGDHQDRLKKDCADIEDKVLEGFGAIEQVEEVAADLKQQLTELKQEKDEFEAQWKTDAVEYQAELDKILERRAEHLTSLPKGPVMVYERVLKGREGEAVVPAEGRNCGGCRMAIIPNDMTKLQGMTEVVTCKSCDRILYIPGFNGAAG